MADEDRPDSATPEEDAPDLESATPAGGTAGEPDGDSKNLEKNVPGSHTAERDTEPIDSALVPPTTDPALESDIRRLALREQEKDADIAAYRLSVDAADRARKQREAAEAHALEETKARREDEARALEAEKRSADELRESIEEHGVYAGTGAGDDFDVTITLPDGSQVTQTTTGERGAPAEVTGLNRQNKRRRESGAIPIEVPDPLEEPPRLLKKGGGLTPVERLEAESRGGFVRPLIRRFQRITPVKKLAVGGAAVGTAVAIGAVALAGSGGNGDPTVPASSGGDVGGASTAAAGAAGAGAAVTATSGGRTRPVVIDLCAAGGDPISAMGLSIPVAEGQVNNDAGFAFCNWESDAGGISATISRTSNAAAARAAWEQTFDGGAVVSLDWSPDGVFRDRDGESAWLWAYIINTDYVNRDVYLEVHVTAGLDANGQSEFPPLPGQLEAVVTLGKVLSEAARAGQPEGVILPDLPE